ncbi:NrsF family protein [Chthonobacter albigriseus]|uniref:NrsF family protein n=1 Tax=Chthonobacter albigriseus TaxID=1683161 RepID=UPI0015EF4AAF|nr:NrsF family protein [Chthonobacter albigriseus]
MKTEDLIHALAADGAVRPVSLARAFAIAGAVAVAYAGLVFAIGYGPRPDVAAAIETVRFPLKVLTVLLFALGMARVAGRLAQPGASLPVGLAAGAVGLLAASVALELFLLPREAWMPALVGTNSLLCLMSIPLLGAGALAASLLALRQGAPTRPALAGAAVGLLSGAVGAVFYAVHCPDDSPLFVVTWYSLALALMTGVGALAGRLALRW